MIDIFTGRQQLEIVSAFAALATAANEHSHKSGFWTGQTYETHGAMKIALMHSELSEALEAMRVNNFDGQDGVCHELADTIIRILDYANEAALPLAEQIMKNMQRNTKRGHKHGKQF